MANRDVAKNASATRVTTTSATYQDALTLTWTPSAASTDYWLLYSATADYSAATSDVLVKFINSTTPTDLCSINIEPKDTTDRIAVFGLSKWTSPSSPVSQSFKIQYASESGRPAGCANMVAWAIEKRTGDQYIETDGEISTTSASYQDAQDLTFTPASQGDYLIVAYAEIDVSTALGGGSVQLTVDGTASHIVDPYDISELINYSPWMAVHKVNLTAASHTIKIQYNGGGTNNANIRRRRILAIRLDTLRSNSADYTSTRATTTSTTAVDAASTTFTAAGSVDYFVIGNVTLDGSSTTISTNAQVLMDGAVTALHAREPFATTTERPYAALSYSAFASGSRTCKTQVYSETASITTGYSYRGIYVLDLREVAAGGATTRPLNVGMVNAGVATLDQFSAGTAFMGWSN